jgi:hypothetical protein
MKRTLLIVALLVVLAGCGDEAKTESAGAGAQTPTTIPTNATATTAAPTTASTVAASTTTSAGAKCQNVTFPPTDEIATSIMAYGMPCGDAEAFVKRVGQPLGPEGPAQLTVEGFTCQRTAVTVTHSFDVGSYDCKNGAQRITFGRTRAG